MTATTIDPAQSATLDRSAMHTRVRAELRAAHQRLTDRQIDLIADVAVELRLTRVRLELQPTVAVD